MQAVLLVNLGTPEEPSTEALRPYLQEFLSDPRVIDLPRWQWLPILHGIVLRLRPRKSAAAYQKIWTQQGSPLLIVTKQQTAALQAIFGAEVKIEYAMRYGFPSIAEKIKSLQEQGINKILIVPMYPQYCSATTATVFDAVADYCKTTKNIPDLRFIRDWHDNPKYINALANSILSFYADKNAPEKILFSFHGVPKRFCETEGDPYYQQCKRTMELVAGKIPFPTELVFQSRFGSEEWLKPYADETIKNLTQNRIGVICAGFTADCLETLEEMAVENRKIFKGKEYHYIPALNVSSEHIALLVDLIRENLWKKVS